MLSHLTPAGTFFLFAFMCVPETTGKSLEEIEKYRKNR